MKPSLVGLFMALNVCLAAGTCDSPKIAKAQKAIDQIKPQGWAFSVRSTDRILGLDDQSACEVELRDPRPESAYQENSAKHGSSEPTRSAPYYYFWLIEGDPKTADAIRAKLRGQMMRQMLMPTVLGTAEKMVVLMIKSAGTSWPDAPEKVTEVLKLSK